MLCLGSPITPQGLAANWSSGGEKIYIVYSLFCTVIIFIITVTTSSSIISSISFIVVLNFLYLNPWVFPFVHFFSPPCSGWRRQVSEWISRAELLGAGLSHHNPSQLFSEW